MFSESTKVTLAITVLVGVALAHLYFSETKEKFANIEKPFDLSFGTGRHHNSQEIRCLIDRTRPQELSCGTVVNLEDRPQSSSNPRNFMTF
jgi:hypothetical protein